ncbi:MAG: hypothetical protein GY858_08750 [Candidatus Omnitrophica bacterium]|nr:hypothetical protein [Candidatus Omnitrophota bacterium]
MALDEVWNRDYRKTTGKGASDQASAASAKRGGKGEFVAGSMRDGGIRIGDRLNKFNYRDVHTRPKFQRWLFSTVLLFIMFFRFIF